MNFILKRTYFNDATIGIFYQDGVDNPVLFSIERPWLSNERNISCIPEGVYTVNPYNSSKFPDVWEIMGVKDRSYILIHAGNFADDVKGCIALGLTTGYMIKDSQLQKTVSNSRNAITQLKKITNYPESFTLTITS